MTPMPSRFVGKWDDGPGRIDPQPLRPNLQLDFVAHQFRYGPAPTLLR